MLNTKYRVADTERRGKAMLTGNNVETAITCRKRYSGGKRARDQTDRNDG